MLNRWRIVWLLEDDSEYYIEKRSTTNFQSEVNHHRKRCPEFQPYYTTIYDISETAAMATPQIISSRGIHRVVDSFQEENCEHKDGCREYLSSILASGNCKGLGIIDKGIKSNRRPLLIKRGCQREEAIHGTKRGKTCKMLRSNLQDNVPTKHLPAGR